MDSGSDDEVLECFFHEGRKGDRKERCGCTVFSPSGNREMNTTIDIIPPFRRYNIYGGIWMNIREDRKCD